MNSWEIMNARKNIEVPGTELYLFPSFDEYLRVRARQGVKK